MKVIPEYLLTISFAVAFTLFFDINIGLPICIVLVLSPVISILSVIAVKRYIKVSVLCDNLTLNKGDMTFIKIKLKNESFIPVAFIMVNAQSSMNLIPIGDNSFSFSLSARQSQEISIRYQATFFGQGSVSVSKVIISDLLGLVRIEIPNVYNKNKIFNILPDIIKTDEENEFLRVAFDTVAYSDDDEEESICTYSAAKGGMPGFDHREYVPGDSLKRINYKLSSKRKKLLVRLDENTTSFNQNIIIDPYSRCLSINKDKGQYLKEEIIIESCLSLLWQIVNNQVVCSVYYYLNDMWKFMRITDFSDITTLQYELSFYQFIDHTLLSRLPFDLLKEDKTVKFATVLSSSADNSLFGLAKTLCDEGMITHIVVNDKCSDDYDNLWFVDNSRQFKHA